MDNQSSRCSWQPLMAARAFTSRVIGRQRHDDRLAGRLHVGMQVGRLVRDERVAAQFEIQQVVNVGATEKVVRLVHDDPMWQTRLAANHRQRGKERLQVVELLDVTQA